MIFDKIENWKIYFKHCIFNKIFEDLNKINLDTSNGIYFKNKDYYFKVMSYKTKIESDIIENHKKEVDIQILLSGSEKIKLFSIENVVTLRAYSDSDDCQFFSIKTFIIRNLQQMVKRK
jgi:beta-galactosidase beta subunit